MRHRKSGKRLNRSVSHRQAMLDNMATSLLLHERISTTEAKASAVVSHTEKLITLGRRGDVHARRQANRNIRDKAVLSKLFGELAERYKDRSGGYSRVIKTAQRRHGDAAPLAIVELVDSDLASKKLEQAETPEAGTEVIEETAVAPPTTDATPESVEDQPKKRKWQGLERMLGWTRSKNTDADNKAMHRKTSKGTGRSGGKKDSRGKSR